METTIYHTPVLLRESVSYLVTTQDGLYVDCTLGGGGHAESVLQQLRGGRLIGLDRDEEAIQVSRERLHGFGETFEAIHSSFGETRERLLERGISKVHGVMLDLGISSHHIDEPGRGFSFQGDGPLDMRMDRRGPVTAADVVNTHSEQDLASILTNYGEEREAGRIARAIVRKRPVKRTAELAAIVESVVPERAATKTLARVFQAIRIEVNSELNELRRVLQSIPDVLLSKGRVVVLTYHSLEDRIVKEFFRTQSATRDPSVSRYLPEQPLTPLLAVLTRKPVTAGEKEVASNPRARSAKLRAAERL